MQRFDKAMLLELEDSSIVFRQAAPTYGHFL